MMKTNSLGLYVHIPLCIKKCGYCAFISFDKKSPSQWQEYVNELLKEIRGYGETFKEDYLVDTIFFGGGTPSILAAEAIQEIIEQIKNSFSLAQDVEITIEANPGTISEEKLEKYLSMGINRLSIGVQSFDEDLLLALGRIHGKAQAKEAYKLARNVGFKNINLDLIFAIPGQSFAKWESSLRQTIELNPEHVSFYGLSYEEGTPFDEARKRKELLPATEDLDRRMYKKAIDMLVTNGYEHYEISNMAKAGYSCKHNIKYWSMEDYLGMGISAHSFIKGKRFSNTGTWEKYFFDNKLEEEHINSEYDNISEYIFTGMRKIRGVLFQDFREKFGLSYFDYLGSRKKELFDYQEKKLLVVDSQGMHFTEAGIDLSNGILADLM